MPGWRFAGRFHPVRPRTRRTATSTSSTRQPTAGTIGLADAPAPLRCPRQASLIITNTQFATATYVSSSTVDQHRFERHRGGLTVPPGSRSNPNPGLPYAYVTNSNDSTVSIIDTQTWTVVGTFASGAGRRRHLGIWSRPTAQHLSRNYDGGGDDYGTVPVFQVATPVEQGGLNCRQVTVGALASVNAPSRLCSTNKGSWSGSVTARWRRGTTRFWRMEPSCPTAGLTTCSNGSPNGCWTVVSHRGPHELGERDPASGPGRRLRRHGDCAGRRRLIGGFNGAAANFGPDGAFFDASSTTFAPLRRHHSSRSYRRSGTSSPKTGRLGSTQ